MLSAIIPIGRRKLHIPVVVAKAVRKLGGGIVVPQLLVVVVVERVAGVLGGDPEVSVDGVPYEACGVDDALGAGEVDAEFVLTLLLLRQDVEVLETPPELPRQAAEAGLVGVPFLFEALSLVFWYSE